MNSQVCASDSPGAPGTVPAIEQLETHLQTRLAGRVRELRVLAWDHGLVLRGWSRSYYAKQLAQHALMTATPFPLVANEIEVR
jgi:hypothetical protein